MGKKEYPSIYFLKGVCSLLVVLIHTQFFFHSLYTPFYRLAVPLFFIISGFFLVDELGDLRKTQINKSLIKMMKLNIKFSFIYIILYNFRLLYINEDININILLPDPFWLNLFWGHPYCGVLWYVTAFIEILIVLKLFSFFYKEFVLVYLIPILLLLELLFGKYSFLLDIEFSHFFYRNFVTMGLPFVLLGIAIRKYQLFKLTSNLKILVAILFLISYAEYYFIQKNGLYREGDVTICTIFLAPILFIYFINNSTIKNNNLMSIIGKKYSMNIYFYHPMVISLFYTLDMDKIFHNYEYIIVLILTLLVCICLEKINKMKLRLF